MVDALREAIHALSETLTPVLLRYEAAQAVPARDAAQDHALDRVQLRQDLTALSHLLKNSDMVALEVHTLVQQTFGAHLSNELKPLKDAMASLDFEVAHAQCVALLQSHTE